MPVYDNEGEFQDVTVTRKEGSEGAPGLDGITLLPRGVKTFWFPAAEGNFTSKKPGEQFYTGICFHTPNYLDQEHVNPKSCVQWFANPFAGVSTHYYIDRFGNIYQSVNEQDRSKGVSGDVDFFTTYGSRRPTSTNHLWYEASRPHARTNHRLNAWAPNDNLISIEMEGNHFYHRKPDGSKIKNPAETISSRLDTRHVRGARMFLSLAGWLEFVTRKYGIPLNRDYLVKHQECQARGDPGPGFPIDSVINKAKELRGSISSLESPYTGKTVANGTAGYILGNGRRYEAYATQVNYNGVWVAATQADREAAVNTSYYSGAREASDVDQDVIDQIVEEGTAFTIKETITQTAAGNAARNASDNFDDLNAKPQEASGNVSHTDSIVRFKDNFYMAERAVILTLREAPAHLAPNYEQVYDGGIAALLYKERTSQLELTENTIKQIYDFQNREVFETILFDQSSRIKFSIKYNAEANQRKRTISVYNISNQTYDKIINGAREFSLSVGYGNRLNVICEGSIRSIDRVWDGPNSITTFVCGELVSRAQSLFNQSFQSIELGSLLEMIVHTMGLNLGRISHLGPKITEQITNVSYNLPPEKALADLCNRVGLRYSIFCGIVRFIRLNTDQYLSDTYGIVRPYLDSPDGIITLSEKTGIIGNPTALLANEGSSQGFKCDIRINTGVLPFQQIKLESKAVTGDFFVSELSFEGDSWSGPFKASLTGRGTGSLPPTPAEEQASRPPGQRFTYANDAATRGAQAVAIDQLNANEEYQELKNRLDLAYELGLPEFGQLMVLKIAFENAAIRAGINFDNYPNAAFGTEGRVSG